MSGSAGNTSKHGISLPPAVLGFVCFIIGLGMLISPWFYDFVLRRLAPIGLILVGAVFLLIAFRSRPRPRPDLPPLGSVAPPPPNL